jgi:GNAT superfamily N-acetyltransferase
VGTIGAVVDDKHNLAHNEQTGGFGFFETIDEPAVAAALFSAAEDWVRLRGMTLMRGPLNFSMAHECGLLIDGFNESPMVMMTYNPRYYAQLIEDLGYKKAVDLFAYIGDLNELWQNAPQRVFRVAHRAMQKQGIRVRKADRRHFEREVRLIQEIYNCAWAGAWDFEPITDAQANYLAASLKPVLDPELVLIAETADGRPIGVSLTIPDVNQALQWSGGGHMFPLGALKFLWYKRKMWQARLILLAVVEEYRFRGIDALFYIGTGQAARARGYKRLECSWILETNTMMNKILQHIGFQRYKTYRIYEKGITLSS